MKFICLFFFIFFHSYAFSQKEAYNWIWGTCFPEFGCDGIDDGLNGTGIMKFNNDSLESITTKYFPAPFTKGSATISDSTGNFLMAFNGKTLFDSSGNVIAELSNVDYDDLIVGYRGFLFLKPRFNDEYYLINSICGNFANSLNPHNVGIDTLFTVSKLKVNQSGYTIEESISYELPISTVPGGIDACRHANGRDWWILKLGQRKNQYVRGLLTPYSVQLDPYYSNQDSAYVSFGWASFSSDGSKYVHWFGGHIRELQVFDFDRCTGELSNMKTFDFSNIIENDLFIDFTPFSLSPDGSKVYMQKVNYITMAANENLQFDLNNELFSVVTGDLGVLCITPNLKHMIGGFCCDPSTPSPNVPYAGLVLNPNLHGQDCNYLPLRYELPLYGFIYTPPNQANHLLGPIDETVCDTLGLDDETTIIKLEEFCFNVYPNPGNEVIHFTTDLPLPLKLTIRDNQGRIVIEKTKNQKSFTVQDRISELNAGIYFIELISLNAQYRLMKKWMKLE